MTDFYFYLEDGSPPSSVMVSDRVRPNFSCPGNRKLSLDTSAAGPFIFFRGPDGFWDRVAETATLGKGPIQIIFPKIVVGNTSPWWHDVHGLSTAAALPDSQLRIGVVDEALAVQKSASCIFHVENLGAEAWGSRKTSRALTPRTLHGHAVCSLIGSRADPSSGFSGVYPEAKLYFAAAGRDSDEKLSLGRLNACIELLVEKYKCDIISISAGDYSEPLLTLEETVKSARDDGTLCFFAAGNLGKPLYPARQPDCLAVAALGHMGIAPPGTNVALADLAQSEPLAEPFYLWSGSARGLEIEFCAPGVGVVWSMYRTAAKPAIGTSYACPIAAAVAARILVLNDEYRLEARSSRRATIALDALIAACRPFGGPNEHACWKYGRYVVP